MITMITYWRWEGWAADTSRLVLEHWAMPGYEVDLESVSTKQEALDWILHLFAKLCPGCESRFVGFITALEDCCDPRTLPDVPATKEQRRERIVTLLRRQQDERDKR